MVRMRRPEAPLFENLPPRIYTLEVRWLTKWRRPEPDEVTEKALIQTEEEEKAICISLGALPLDEEIEKLKASGQISREGRVSRVTSPLIQTTFFNPETGNWLRPWRDWIRPILGLPAGKKASDFIEANLEFPLDWLLGMRFRAEVYQEPRLAGGFWSRFRNPAPAEAWEQRNLELLEARIAEFMPRAELREDLISKEAVERLRVKVNELMEAGLLNRKELNKILDEISSGQLKKRARKHGVSLAEALFEFEAELLFRRLKEIEESPETAFKKTPPLPF